MLPAAAGLSTTAIGTDAILCGITTAIDLPVVHMHDPGEAGELHLPYSMPCIYAATNGVT